MNGGFNSYAFNDCTPINGDCVFGPLDTFLVLQGFSDSLIGGITAFDSSIYGDGIIFCSLYESRIFFTASGIDNFISEQYARDIYLGSQTPEREFMSIYEEPVEGETFKSQVPQRKYMAYTGYNAAGDFIC